MTANLDFQQPVNSIISWVYMFLTVSSTWCLFLLVDFSVNVGVKLLPSSVRGKLEHPQLLCKNPFCSFQSLREQK